MAPISKHAGRRCCLYVGTLWGTSCRGLRGLHLSVEHCASSFVSSRLNHLAFPLLADLLNGGLGDLLNGRLRHMLDGGLGNLLNGGRRDLRDGGLGDLLSGGLRDLSDGGPRFA